MNVKRWTVALLVLIALLVVETAEAGWISRGKNASKALFGRVKAPRCWVVFPPTSAQGGDLEVVCLSLAGSDPGRPAALVRFQRTDAAIVGEEVRVGTLLTLMDAEVETGGLLPVYLPAAKSDRGWKADWIPRVSETMGRQGYLVAGVVLSQDQGELDRFFNTRPGLRALLEDRTLRVARAVFPGGLPDPEPPLSPAEELASCRPRLLECEAERDALASDLRAADAAVAVCRGAQVVLP